MAIPTLSPLDWYEYAGVVFVLIVSVALIFWKRSVDSNSTVLSNGMSLGPVAISLISSSVSGMSLLAKPADAYKHGIEFFAVSTTFLAINFILNALIFMPVMFKLPDDSIYQYFERRFNKSVRLLTSASFILSNVLGSAAVTLPPCIVINHFSGLPMNFIIICILLTTTFYTTLGGFVGVVWTDAFQGIVMFVTVAVLCFISMAKVGGPGEVLRIARETGRLNLPETPFDPTARLPFWTYFCFLSGLSTVVLNQSMYQRYKSLDKKRTMTISLFFQFMGTTFFAFSAFTIGLSAYAYYYGCDPKSAKIVNSYTNVIVYWLDDVGQNVKGFRGAYIAGITCASISTLSTHINSCACLISKDFIPLVGFMSDPKKFAFFVKLSAAFVGLSATALAMFFEGTSSLLELRYYLCIMDGVISAFFALGVLFVPANSKGTLIGGMVGTVCTLIMLAGSRVYETKGLLPTFEVSYMRTDECPGNLTSSEPPIKLHSTQLPFGNIFDILFRLSPFILTVVAFAITVLVGFLSSLVFRDSGSDLRDINLYSPLAFKIFSRRISGKRPAAKQPLMTKSI